MQITKNLIELYKFYNLALAIVEAVFLSQNDDAKHACGHAVWANILVMCILRFLSTGYSVQSRKSSDRNEVRFKLSVDLLWIWTLINFHGNSSDCVQIFKDTWPNI